MQHISHVTYYKRKDFSKFRSYISPTDRVENLNLNKEQNKTIANVTFLYVTKFMEQECGSECSDASATLEPANVSDTLKANSHIACRAYTIPLPCRAAKGLECVFLI